MLLIVKSIYNIIVYTLIFTKMGFGKKQYFFTIKIVLFGGYTWNDRYKKKIKVTRSQRRK